jgi:hypothetical protein
MCEQSVSKTESVRVPSIFLFGGIYLHMTLAQKEMVDELKIQWKQLWRERLDDKVRAEGIAVTDYSKLYVEQGTIIHATRDYKPLNFKEILERNKVENSEDYIQPSSHVGGWTKFIKTQINNQKLRRNTRATAYFEDKKIILQPKKGGRGWLHKC